MDDPFLKLKRPDRYPMVGKRPESAPVSHGLGAGNTHQTRKHSKFSASGADRWFACPGSVWLSEGMPDKSSIWADEGTLAHEVLEALLLILLSGNDGAVIAEWQPVLNKSSGPEMSRHVRNSAEFILKRFAEIPDAEFLVETKIYLDFIDPEAFGTFDSAIVDYWGTLHVFDFKYGAGKAVSVKDNLQMVFYAIGLAHLHKWNFKKIRMWIVQPRISGFNGPVFWEIATCQLQAFVPRFEKAIQRVKEKPDLFVEGPHCWWCKAKPKCPLKTGKRLEDAKHIFG